MGPVLVVREPSPPYLGVVGPPGAPGYRDRHPAGRLEERAALEGDGIVPIGLDATCPVPLGQELNDPP